MTLIRPATVEDAPAIGALLVRAWQDSFAGIVPKASLDKEDPVETSNRCAGHIADPTRVVFVAEARGTIAGVVFAVLPPEGKSEGEIKSLFIDQASYRKGLGRALMAAVAQAFVARGITSLTLGVFRDNSRARHFYEALGGEKFKDTLFTWDGHPLPEVHYRFGDLGWLASL